MPDHADLRNLPEAIAVPHQRMRVSAVWIIPILAALVALGIAIQRVWSEGPTITILFDAAPGIEAGKTFVKYKDVRIGQVTAVQLSEEPGKVEVTAKIARSAARLMVEDAQFWVVRPRIGLSEISGLATLLSGNYIGFEAGTSNNERRHFTGLEVPRIGSANVPGREFLLKAGELRWSSAGAPVYYRHVPVGQVVAYDLAPDGKAVDVKLFINAPYDKYVSSETRFWDVSGLDISLDTSGVELRSTSLEALIGGGVAFDTPASADPPAPAVDGAPFTLYRDRTTAMRHPDAIATPYILHFGESLQGLAVGAPVTFLGIPAGEVTEVGLSYDAATLDVRPRVAIILYAERLLARLPSSQQAAAQQVNQDVKKSLTVLQRLVEKRGLRAQLRSVNLLTGKRYVALDYFADAPRARLDLRREPLELPVVVSTMPDLEAKLASLLAKLDRLPLESIGADMKNALETLDQTMKNVDKTLPGVQTTLEEARRAIASVDRLATNADTTLIGPNAPAQQELRDALQEVTAAARALRVLADSIERHPESLLRGRVDKQ
jgi:paraquat-inducible protein B